MIVAGFGFNSKATESSLRDALHLTGITPDAIATVSDKSTAEVFRIFVENSGLPLITVDDLTAGTTTVSIRSQSERGTGSVAEACALGAVRAGHLTLSRVISADRNATCAIAEGEPI